MTKAEAIQVMAILAGLYGQGKGNPEVMAESWYLILEPYDFQTARKAVLNFAKNDTREYGTFPTVGNIVKEIEAEMAKEQAPIKEVVRAISYGWSYDQLSDKAKANITKAHYEDWLNMDAEEFALNAGKLASSLKRNQKMLTEGK
jgi:hypothetical protein